MIGIEDIEQAYVRIKKEIYRTPLIYSDSLSRITGAEIYLKAENLQRTGSFKVRGACNKMTGISGDKVIAASMGNHSQGVAFAAGRFGKHATVVMPRGVSISKEEATKGYGAEVILHGDTLGEALDFAMSQKDHVFIHPFDDHEIIAGQGTVGLEIAGDLRDIDAVLVPVGGGGLISGVGIAMRALSKNTSVVGVQCENASSAFISLKEKKPRSCETGMTLADGIAVGCVGDKTFEIMRNCVDDMMLVSEESISRSVLLLLERKKLVAEGAGALPLAALINGKESFKGKRVVLVVSGGNIDSTLVDRIIHRGLVAEERIAVFTVTAEDVPGSLHAITGVIASCRGNIVHVYHERMSRDLAVGETKVRFTVEVRNREHARQIADRLRNEGFRISGA